MPKPLFQQLWHGDSIELCKRFKDGSVDCVITDPPFGVDNQSNSAVTAEGKAQARKIANDESPEVAIQVFKAVMDVLLRKTAEDSDLYIFTSYQVLDEWLAMTKDFLPHYGYRRKAIGIWEKDGPGQGDLTTWGMGMEFILYFKKGKRATTDKRRNFVLHTPQVRPDKLIHPHEKPPGLLEQLIRHSTDPNDFCVDPFGGSGSLARACRNTGRSAVTIELDEYNHRVSKKRFDAEGEGLFRMSDVNEFNDVFNTADCYMWSHCYDSDSIPEEWPLDDEIWNGGTDRLEDLRKARDLLIYVVERLEMRVEDPPNFQGAQEGLMPARIPGDEGEQVVHDPHVWDPTIPFIRRVDDVLTVQLPDNPPI